MKFDIPPNNNKEPKLSNKIMKKIAVVAGALGIMTPAIAQEKNNNNKEVEPIVVTDKYDKTLKAYNDSLALYNASVKSNQNILNKTYIKDNRLVISLEEALKIDNSEKKHLRANSPKILPISELVYPVFDEKRNKFIDSIYVNTIYGKPIQPVVYKKPEIKKDVVKEKPIPNPEKIKPSKPLPEIKETEYTPEPEGVIIYGPSYGAIGYMNEGFFTPIKRRDHLAKGKPETEDNPKIPGANESDINLLNNPSALYKFLKDRYGEYFKGIKQD